MKKALVIVEVVVIFLSGTLAARPVLRLLDLAGAKQAIGAATETAFDAASVAVAMSIRWAIVIGLALLAGWLIARHRLRDYGLTSAGRPLTFHLGVGLLIYVFGHAPVAVANLSRHYLDLPGGPAVWKVIDNAVWNLDFWLFMLASSIVIPVVVEEIFFRGYAQTRLCTVFSPMATIIAMSVVFMLVHTQYLDGTIIGTLQIITGIWSVILLGLARLRTESLIAPMLAHAIGNTPVRPQMELFLLACLAVAAIVLWPRFLRFMASPWKPPQE